MRKFLIGLALCVGGAVNAAAVYTAQTYGTAVTQINYYDSRCNHTPPNSYPYLCDPHLLTDDWSGFLTVSLSGSADGTYSGEDILSFTYLVDGYFEYTTNGIGINDYNDTDPQRFATVIIKDGRIVSVTEKFWTSQYFEYFFNGTDAGYKIGFNPQGNQAHHASVTEATGVLAAVPEPSSWALLGLGLLTVLTFARLRKRT